MPRRVTDVDPKFKPSHAPLLEDRSPYPTRISDARYVEEDFDRDSVVGSVERSELFSEPAEAGRELTSGAEGASAEVLNGGNGVDKVDVCVLKDLIEAMKMQSVQQMVAQREFEADRIKREDERLRRLEEERFARESDRLRQIEEEKYRRDAERDVKRKKEVRRSELLKGLHVYKEGSSMCGFLLKFERIMGECDIEEDEWIRYLFPNLSDKLYARLADCGCGDDYGETRKVLLMAVRETVVSYGHMLFDTLGEQLKTKNAGDIHEFMRRMVSGLFQGCESVKDCEAVLAIAFTRHIMPLAGKTFLETRKLVTMADHLDAWETWLSGRQSGIFFRPRVSGYGGVGNGNFVKRMPDRSVSSSNGGSGSTFVFSCFGCGEKGHRLSECPKRVVSGSNGGKIVCHTCGVEGHKSTDCPSKKGGAPKKSGSSDTKISMLSADRNVKKNVISGRVNGKLCDILVDSGADVALVPRSVVGYDCVQCGDIKVSGAVGEPDVRASTKVVFEIDGVKLERLALIDENECERSMFIIPFDMCDEDQCKLFQSAIKRVGKERVSEVKVLMRAQECEERVLDTNDVDASAEDLWSVIEPEESVSENGDEAESVVEASEDLAEADPQQECFRESVAEVSGMEMEDDVVLSDSEAVNLSEVSESECDRELLDAVREVGPMGKGSDCAEFKLAVMSDPSLKTWRGLADKQERGFRWRNGLVVQIRLCTGNKDVK